MSIVIIFVGYTHARPILLFDENVLKVVAAARNLLSY